MSLKFLALSGLLAFCMPGIAEALDAYCIMDGENGAGDILGTINLSEASEADPLRITGELSGAEEGLHGFHIHENGDLGNNCADAGGHFNPFGKKHGAPDAEERHVGDLGNVDSEGVVSINIEDDLASLYGDNSVLGKAIVIHELADDLGLGGDEGSETTGNAGARLGCCRITEGKSPGNGASSIKIGL